MKFSSNQVLCLVSIVFLVSLILVIFDLDTTILSSLNNFCKICS